MRAKMPVTVLALAVCAACGDSTSTSSSEHSMLDAAAGGDAGSPSTTGDDGSGPVDAAGGGAGDGAIAMTTPPPEAGTDAQTAAPDAAGATDAAAATDASGPGCAAGCDQGKVCAYLIADACGAAGACVTPPAPSACGAIVEEMACGCDGTAVDWVGGCKPSLPAGYAPAPVTHMGACN